jgi:hypothetical protein
VTNARTAWDDPVSDQGVRRVYVDQPEELSVEIAVGQYHAGRISADQAVEQLRLVRSRGLEARADRLAAFYLGEIAAGRRQPAAAEAMYRIALDPAYPDVAAGAALNLGLVLCVQESRRAEGEELLRQAASSGQEQSVAAARKTLADLRAGTWPTAEDLAAFDATPTPPSAGATAPPPAPPPAVAPAPPPAAAETPRAKWWQRDARRGERLRKADAARQARLDEIAAGWNGVRWGDTVDAFRARFPLAQPKDSWWVTGTGKETFLGVRADAQYAFNPRGRFYLVAFYPAAHDRTALSLGPYAYFGDPPGGDLTWPMSADVVVDVKSAGVAATVYHRGLRP